MSKFIYKDTLQTKYNEGTILTDDVKCKTLEVNKITSDNPFNNIDKDINLNGDLSVSGDINIDDVDISTIKTNTITSDNTKIDFNKGINTTKYLSIGNNNYNITTDGGLCLGNFAASPYNDGVFKIGIGTGNNDRQTGLLFDNNGVLNVKNKIITNDLQSKNGNNIIKIYDNSIEISKDGGTNWTNLIKSGTGNNSIILNYPSNTASGNYSYVEGYNTKALGTASHAEGRQTTAGVLNATSEEGYYSHAEGFNSLASGKTSHAEGYNTKSTSDCSHAEGHSTTASASFSHAEGHNTIASGESSHAEGGGGTKATGKYSHAEGYNTQTLSGNYPSHSEGSNTKARGESAHAEGHVDGNDSGKRTINGIEYNLGANAKGSHSEGHNTIAQGIASHAEGGETVALSNYSHAGGFHTISNTVAGTAVGKYNISGTNKLFVVGNGTDDNNRSDAFVVYDNGNILFNNNLFMSGSGHSQFLTYANQNTNDNSNDTRAISNGDFNYYILNNLININIPLKSGNKFVSAYRSLNSLKTDFVDYYIINLDFSSIKSFLDNYYNANSSRFESCCNCVSILTNPEVSHCLRYDVSSASYANCYSNGISIILVSQGPATGDKSTDPFRYYIKDFNGFVAEQVLSCTISYKKLS